MKRFIYLVVIFLISNLLLAQNYIENEIKKYYKNLPFEMPVLKAPVFPDKDYLITDFGALGDGITLNTDAFEKAMIECEKNGGGRIIVPKGIWLTGTIKFRSNVNLYLERGALIQFSKNFDHYPLVETTYEGTEQYRCQSPISGKNLTNIAITGYGVIDGGGDAWRYVKKSKLTSSQWKELVASGGVVDSAGNNWWPSEQAMNGEKILNHLKKQKGKLTKEDYQKVRDYLRPVMVNFINCKNILLEGVTFQNSPAWNIHPLMSENIILSNVTVRNPWYSQNGDGIDVESCKNVIIYDCKFDVGDDAICMKSGRDEFGRKRGIPTENVIIADCIVYHGHGGFTIGSEMSGGVRNIKVTNCNFIGTDIGLRFKSTRGRGGVVENIYIDNIFMKDIPTDALSFNMYYGGQAPTEDLTVEEKLKSRKGFTINEGTPQFRNIFLENIYCIGAKDAIVIQGLPEMKIKNIVLKNIKMKAQRGVSIYDADGIKLINAEIYSKDPAIKIYQSRDILVENFVTDKNLNTILKLEGDETAEIKLKGEVDLIMKKILSDESVPKDAVRILN